jgi:hypothetical protein
LKDSKFGGEVIMAFDHCPHYDTHWGGNNRISGSQRDGIYLSNTSQKVPKKACIVSTSPMRTSSKKRLIISTWKASSWKVSYNHHMGPNQPKCARNKRDNHGNSLGYTVGHSLWKYKIAGIAEP